MNTLERTGIRTNQDSHVTVVAVGSIHVFSSSFT